MVECLWINRKDIFRIIRFAIVLIVLLGFRSSSALFIAGELLGRATPNSVTINACADSTVQAYYEFGSDSLALTRQTSVLTVADSIPFVAVLDGLLPNSQYYYRLRYRYDTTAVYRSRPVRKFRTANTDGHSFTFSLIADPHMDTASSAAVFTRTLSNIAAANTDFMIDLGDNFFCEKYPPYSVEKTLQRHLLLRSYYDQVCHSLPLYLVLGNHEGEQGWRLNGTASCLPVWATNTRKAYFPNPEPDGFYSGDTTHEAFVGRRQAYYSWEWGNALFVVLDLYWYPTTNPQQDFWRYTLGATQYNWFASVLQNSQAQFKFVFIHQLVGGNATDPRGGIETAPYYEQGGRNIDSTWGFSTRRAGWSLPLHQLMVNNGVTALFHGHDHFYAKQDLDSIVYQLVPQPSTTNTSSINSAATYGYTHGTLVAARGYLNIAVSETSCTVNYYRTYLPSEENASRHNGDLAASYTIIKARPLLPVTIPANLSLEYSEGRATMHWNAAGGTVHGYRVYRDSTGLPQPSGNGVLIGTTTSSTLTFTDTTTIDKAYYRVTAFQNSGSSLRVPHETTIGTAILRKEVQSKVK